jgi:hypothetical protein
MAARLPEYMVTEASLSVEPWVNGEQMGTSCVNAPKHERRTDLTLIPDAGLMLRRKRTGR